MKNIPLIILYILVITPLTSCLEETKKDKKSTISIEQVYGFATPIGASTGAAFMEIRNNRADNDSLISVQSSISKVTEIHQNMVDPDDGTMMMRRIKKLDLPKDQKVILDPTGYHIMFIGLNKQLTIGQKIPLQLTFEKSKAQNIMIEIVAPGTKPE